MKTFILSLALLVAPLVSAHAYLSVSPSSMEFGSVKIGTQMSQMFFVTNLGNEDVQIQGCNLFGVFQCQLNCFGTLSRGQSCSGTIYFFPHTETYEYQTAIINTNRGSATISVHGFGKI